MLRQAYRQTLSSQLFALLRHQHQMQTNGNTPNINAIEVMMMGLKRSLTASKVAFSSSIPLSTRSLANSTIKMAFLAAKPISVIKPICA
jgi:hypothetical protein